MKKLIKALMGVLNMTTMSQKDGKSYFTEEEQTKIKALVGDDALQKINTHLAQESEDASSGESGVPDDSNTVENSETAELISALMSQNVSMAANFEKTIADLNTRATTQQAAIDTLSNMAEPDIVPEMSTDIPRSAEASSIMNVDMRKPSYAAVGHFLKTGYMASVEMATIDVADLATEFGTYLSQGRNNLEMVESLFQGFSSSKYFTETLGVTEWRAVQALISSVSQQFTNKWTPSGQTKFRPLKIENFRHKINFPIVPSEVLESYMLHMYNEKLAPDQMPITLYIWNQLIYPQLMQDVELRMMFKGKHVEVTNNDVNEGDDGKPPEDSMDGIETILVDGLVSNDKNINYFPNADGFDFKTATDQEVLSFVDDFTDWLSPLFRVQKMPIGCSDEFRRRYRRAYKNVWGPGSSKSDDTNFGSDQIDFARQYLTPMDGMYNSPILFATPKMNLKKLRHKNQLPNIINDVQKDKYAVNIFGEYWLSGGFAYGEGVFAAVPSGYDPKAEITKVHGDHTEYQQFQNGSGSASGGA